MCDLERACSEDVLLPAISGQLPTSIVIFTTQLLTDVHPFLIQAAVVSEWHGHGSGYWDLGTFESRPPGLHSLFCDWPCTGSYASQVHSHWARRVLIFSSVTEHAHACQASTELGVEAFAEYSAALRHDVREALEAAAAEVGAGQVGACVWWLSQWVLNKRGTQEIAPKLHLGTADRRVAPPPKTQVLFGRIQPRSTPPTDVRWSCLTKGRPVWDLRIWPGSQVLCLVPGLR